MCELETCLLSRVTGQMLLHPIGCGPFSIPLLMLQPRPTTLPQLLDGSGETQDKNDELYRQFYSCITRLSCGRASSKHMFKEFILLLWASPNLVVFLLETCNLAWELLGSRKGNVRLVGMTCLYKPFVRTWEFPAETPKTNYTSKHSVDDCSCPFKDGYVVYWFWQ